MHKPAFLCIASYFKGNDFLRGGAGDDTFVFHGGGGQDDAVGVAVEAQHPVARRLLVQPLEVRLEGVDELGPDHPICDRLQRPQLRHGHAIVDGHGALVSEFPLGTPALADNFPRRNRLIAGLGRGVLSLDGGRIGST